MPTCTGLLEWDLSWVLTWYFLLGLCGPWHPLRRDCTFSHTFFKQLNLHRNLTNILQFEVTIFPPFMDITCWLNSSKHLWCLEYGATVGALRNAINVLSDASLIARRNVFFFFGLLGKLTHSLYSRTVSQTLMNKILIMIINIKNNNSK
jgi:hypothetical protein